MCFLKHRFLWIISDMEVVMTLEEAIQTAIDFETRIRDLYIHAAERIPDPVGRRLFKTLADDEQ